MVTTVGIQGDFSDAMVALLELEYDAIEAYKVTIERLENKEYKSKMKEFIGDHERHVREIEKLLVDHNVEFSSGPSAKQLLTKGKVIIADLIGDNAILMAMLTNEGDTNTAYERMSTRKDYWKDAHDTITKAYADEKKHKKWLEDTLNNS